MSTQFEPFPGNKVQLASSVNPDSTSVPVPGASILAPVADSEGVSVDLPSKFAFYDFKDLYIRPFRGYHLAKLSRAHEEANLRPLVEAVASVVYSTDNPSKTLAFDLTIPDFYFVLYWLRTNCFTKTPYIHTTKCTNPKHLEDVAAGIKTKESLNISHIIKQTNKSTIALEVMPNPELFKLTTPTYESLMLRPPVMQDTLELVEDSKFGDPEFNFLGQLATYISVPNTKTTLATRIEMVKELSADDISVINRFEAEISEYGVVETVQVTCSGCGASRSSKLVLDAHSFLSVK